MQLAPTLQPYVKDLTRDKYENYPQQIENIIDLNIRVFACQLFEKIKTDPSNKNLRIINIQVVTDPIGYGLIEEFMAQNYKIYLEKLNRFSDAKETASGDNVLLKSMPIRLLTACKIFTVTASYKADNPYLFPPPKILKPVAAPFNAQSLAQVEWTKAQQGIGTKVTILVEGVTFNAHKTKLVMHSEFFACKFDFNKLEEQEAEIVKLVDISAEAFGHLLKFIYTGEIPELKSFEKLCEIVHGANVYRVMPLDGVICNQVVDLLSKNSATALELDSLFSTASLYIDSHLAKVCLDYVEANQNMMECLVRALDKHNVKKFIELSKERKLEFVGKKIQKCLKYNSTLQDSPE